MSIQSSVAQYIVDNDGHFEQSFASDFAVALRFVNHMMSHGMVAVSHTGNTVSGAALIIPVTAARAAATVFDFQPASNAPDVLLVLAAIYDSESDAGNLYAQATDESRRQNWPLKFEFWGNGKHLAKAVL